MGMRTGDLHPSVENTILALAWGRPGQIDQRLLDAVGVAGVGLINLVLRKALTEDPLAEAKPVDGKVIEHEPALPALTAGQLETIVPPSRPRKPKGSGPPLKPGEEILP
jgi:hypothetical protein